MQLLTSGAGTAYYPQAGREPRSWMQPLGVSLHVRGGAMQEEGNEVAGPVCCNCWSRGLGTPVWGCRFWSWEAGVAAAAPCTCAGIWTE